MPTEIKTCLIAVRPWSFTASVLPVLLGTVLSWRLGYAVHWLELALCVFGVVMLQSGANLLNDCYDFKRGLDHQVRPVSGAVVRGLIRPEQARSAAFVCLAVGTICGFLLTWLSGWPVLIFGILGVSLAVFYTTAGFCLKFVGLGDAAVFLAFGVLPTLGSFYVQNQTLHWLPLLWNLPLVSLTVGILHANNWRDYQTDPARNCRTVASMLGHRGAAVYYGCLILFPFLFIVAYLILQQLLSGEPQVPRAVLLTGLALPVAFRCLQNSRRAEAEAKADWQKFETLDGQTAKLHLLFGILLLAGLLF